MGKSKNRERSQGMARSAAAERGKAQAKDPALEAETQTLAPDSPQGASRKRQKQRFGHN